MVRRMTGARRAAKVAIALSLVAPGLVSVAHAATSVMNVAVSFGSNRASSSEANALIEYQVDFTVVTPILGSQNDTITLAAHTGTVFPSNSPNSYQVEVVPISGTPTPTTVTGTVTPTNGGATAVIPLPSTFAAVASQQVRVLVGGIGSLPQNPTAAGSYTDFAVSTSKDTTPATNGTAYTITAGATNDTTSTASASPTSQVADGSTASTVTVTLKDTWSNLEPNKTVTLSAGTGSSAIAAGSNGGKTDSNGAITFAVTDAVADGTIVYTADDTTDGVTVVQRASIDFTTGADGNGADAISPTSVVAGAHGTFTITYTPTVATSNGKLQVTIPTGWSAPSQTFTAGGYTVASDGTLSISGQVVSLSALTVNAGHAVTITYGSTSQGGPGATVQTSSGTASFPLLAASTSTGTLTAVSPALSVTVNPGPGDAATSTVTASPTSEPADGLTQSTVTVTVKDAQGNVVPSKTVTLAALGGSSVIGAASGPSDSHGVVTFLVKDAAAESVTYRATDTTDGGGVVITQTAQVAFLPDADGSGTATISPNGVTAGATGGTYTITYTATDGITNGKLTVSVPAGWSAPSLTTTDPGFTTSSTGTVAVSGQLITVSGVTVAAGNSVTITYGSKASGGPGATAQSTAGTATFTVSETASSSGTPVAIGTSPAVAVTAGTVDPSVSTVTTNHSSVLADGSLSGATITVTLLDANHNPVANKTVTLAAGGGHSTISSASGPSNASGVVTFNIGDAFAEGPITYTAKDTTDSNLVITNTAQITFTPPADGSGAATISPTSVVAGSTHSYSIVYTAPAGISSGKVSVTVPAGWTAPQTTTGTAAGFTTASTGTVAVSGQVITVSGLTLSAGQTVTITYGDTSMLGPGATAQTTAGSATFTVKEASTSGGTLTALATSPSVTVTASTPTAGNSTVVANPTSVTADGATASTVTVTLLDQFSNPVSGKTVTLTAGSGHSTVGAASGASDSAGHVTFSVTDTTAEGPITYTAKDTTDNVTPTQTAQITFTAGAVNAGTSAVAAVPTSVIADGTSSSTITVTLRDAQNNPVAGKAVSLAADTGSSVVHVASGTSNASGQAAFTVTDTTVEGPITYTATDTTDNLVITQTAQVTFTPGPSSASLSTVQAAPTSVVSDGTTASTVTVTLIDAESHPVPNHTVTLTPQSGNPVVGAASGPSDSHGVVTFAVTDAHAEGPLAFSAKDITSNVTITQQPQITFTTGPDGMGAAQISPTTAAASGTGTFVITYTPTAGMTSGKVTVGIPTGWTTPQSSTPAGSGYTTASTGTVSVSGRTITVSGVTLAASNPMTVTYGSTTGGGAGATAQSTTGTAGFPVAEGSTSGATPVALATSPSVTVNPGAVSAGHSTVGASPTSALADGVASSTITVTLLDGNNNPEAGKTVSLSQGSGNSTIGPPSGATDSNGQVTFSVSDANAEAVTYTAKDVTDSNLTITQTAAVTFTPPADGNGTNTIAPTHVTEGTTGQTLTLTFSPTAGISNAKLTVTVPAGWPAPSTTASNAGYSKVTTGVGTLAVSGQAINLTGVTVPAGGALTISYGDISGGGPGLTVPGAAGAYTFTTQEASTSGGTLTAIASSPVETIDPGSVSGASSTVGSNPGSVVADGATTSTITVTLKDGAGNPVSGKSVGLTQGGGHSVISAASGNSDTAGVVTFTVTDTHAETVTYTATDSTDSTPVTQTAQVVFTTGAVSASASTVSASPTSVPADSFTTSTVTVTLTDATGNPVSGKTVTLTAASGHSVISAASGPSTSGGVVTFTVKDGTVEGPVSYVAHDTTDATTLTHTASVSYTTVVPSASKSSLAASTNSVPADGVTTSTITATLLDTNSRPISGRTLTLLAGGGSSAIHAVSPTTDGSGQAVFTVSDSHGEGPITYTARDALTSVSIAQTVSVTFTHVRGVGYYMVASDGGLFPFGSAVDHSYGSTGGTTLNKPIVGMALTPTGNGYYLVASDGGLFPFGDALNHSYGSTGGMHLNQPIVGMAVTPSGNGYYLVASDGGLFPFGDALNHSYGSTGGMHLNQPIIGMALTHTGNGYYLVASDGGLFPFGDALNHSYGSTGGMHLNQPIVGMAVTASGNGYYLVASDGGLFPFGDALQHSYGSTGGTHLNQPIVAMGLMPDGNGYYMVASDGGLFPFGSALNASYGSEGGTPLNKPIVGFAVTFV